jgi:GDPmannose 4,6-dehydratase
LKKKSLVFGITGQDGAYLAHRLLEAGHAVDGTSRDAELASAVGLRALGIRAQIGLHSASPTDFRSVLTVITRTEPDEIYSLWGQSSVGLSFAQPAETIESIQMGVLNILEAVRIANPRIRIYNAATSECFGDTKGVPADEETAFRPRSPYGVAKAAAFWQVANYREAYGLFACNGIMFNHESPLRPPRFVTKKIVRAAVAIAAGSAERLKLGNLAIARDWGWAPEYVVAMNAMLAAERADDYVIATGRSHTLEEFVALAFSSVGLDWRAHVDQDPALTRPSEISVSSGNPEKAARVLGWRAQIGFAELVARLVAAERAQATAAS